MQCPYCGKEMEEGYLSSRSPVFWSEGVSGLPIPTRSGEFLLGGKLAGLISRPKAHLCRDCGVVITRC